jgi:hypothetical protein
MRSSALLLLIALSAAGCNRSAPGGQPPMPESLPAQSQETYPTKAEVVDYLDGKTMPTKVPPEPNDKGIVLKRDQIEALEVATSTIKFGDGPWQTDVTFLVKMPAGRYGVRATVKHRRVEGKRAFFGIDFLEVAEQ